MWCGSFAINVGSGEYSSLLSFQRPPQSRTRSKVLLCWFLWPPPYMVQVFFKNAFQSLVFLMSVRHFSAPLF